MIKANFIGDIGDIIKPNKKPNQIIYICSKEIKNNSCEFLSNIARIKRRVRKIIISLVKHLLLI